MTPRKEDGFEVKKRGKNYKKRRRHPRKYSSIGFSPVPSPRVFSPPPQNPKPEPVIKTVRMRTPTLSPNSQMEGNQLHIQF